MSDIEEQRKYYERMMDEVGAEYLTRTNHLKAENERLREENQHIGLIAYELGRTSLAQENDKLRELVRDAWSDGHPDRSCEGCDIRDECHNDVERMRKDGMLRFSRCLFELRIEERMRELGVEL